MSYDSGGGSSNYYNYNPPTYVAGVETAYVSGQSYTPPPSYVNVTPKYAFSNYFTPVDVTQPPAGSPLVPDYVNVTPDQFQPSSGGSGGGGGGSSPKGPSPSGGGGSGSQPQQKPPQQQPQQKTNPITEIIKIFNQQPAQPGSNSTGTGSNSTTGGTATGNQVDIIPGVDNGILIVGGLGILALLAMQKHK